MSFKVNPGRPGFHTVTPYLIVEDAARAIEFYKAAFGATELMRVEDDAGKIRHAEIQVGDSPIMLVDEHPESPAWLGPRARGGSPVHIYLYIDDADAVFKRALAAGATEFLPMQDHDYGDRSGGLTDPFGHAWYVATHLHGGSA